MNYKNTGYFKSFDGTRIYYETRGRGEPLIFLYGVGASINHWNTQVKYFSDSFQTIVFDYRAHHKSDIPRNLDNLSIEDMATDLHQLIRHLDITKASFFGHSLGAQVLVAAYKVNPEVFEKLIFINGFISNPIKGRVNLYLARQLLRTLFSAQKRLPNTLDYVWEKIFTNPLFVYVSALCGGFNSQLTSLKDIEIYGRGVGALDTQSFLILFENMMNYDGKFALREVSCPTLVIAGQKDSMTPLKYQKEIHDNLVNGEWRAISTGSHSTQLDMPDLINLYSEQFLTRT